MSSATLAQIAEPFTIGPLKIDPPILQAPMAGFTNYAFRQIVREFGGAGLLATEMVNARGFVWLTALMLTYCLSDSCGAATNELFADFDEYANAALADWKTPGMAVAVVKEGELIFARGYGIRRVGENSSVDTETIFPIASITKTFNATGLAMLVDEGRLRWNDPVNKHLPSFQLHDPKITREVTIADLLSHRTGLEDPDLLAYSGSVDRDELISRTRFLKQEILFRTGYGYNNLMVTISGEILERVSGESWAHFIRRRVFKPLEMNSTTADILELQGADNMATAYVTVDGDLQEDRSWRLPLSKGWRRFHEAIRPAGAICSTVEDMAKFLTFQLSNGDFRGKELLKGDTLLKMQALHSVLAFKKTPNQELPYPKFLSGYGLGWAIRDYRGRKLVMHGGSTGTVLAMMPEENIGVVVLTNLGCGIQYMVMHDLFDRLLGIPRSWSNRDWITEVIDNYQQDIDAVNARLEAVRDKEITPRLPLDHYAGTYKSDLYGKMVIKNTDGKLAMQLGPNCGAELVHWQGEQYRATFVVRFPQDWFVTFDLSEEDHIVQLKVERVQSRKLISTFRREPNGLGSTIDSTPSK